MDRSTNIEQLKIIIKNFCEERDWGSYHSPKDLAIGAATESAELLEIFRFISDEDCESLLKETAKRENVADELADVLFFLLRFAQKYNFDLTTSFLNKMDKNAKKYPVAKSKGSNKKYNEL